MKSVMNTVLNNNRDGNNAYPAGDPGAQDSALRPHRAQSRPSNNPSIVKSICMICHCEILPDGQAGLMSPPGQGDSHGCCRQCVPELCRLSGLDTTATAEIVAFADATYAHAN
jgi:hypothetical protein